MNLRVLETKDIPDVARVHRLAFPSMAVSRLGLATTRRYYESLMLGPHETEGIGAFAQMELAGYCFVGERYEKESSFIRENFWFLALRISTRPWLITQPLFRDRLKRGLNLLWARMPKAQSVASGRETEHKSFGIQYLAVIPRFQGRGLGKSLLLAGEDLARKKGLAEIKLNVLVDNYRAIELYKQMGWEKIHEQGEWHGLMGKNLIPVRQASPRQTVAEVSGKIFASN